MPLTNGMRRNELGDELPGAECRGSGGREPSYSRSYRTKVCSIMYTFVISVIFKNAMGIDSLRDLNNT